MPLGSRKKLLYFLSLTVVGQENFAVCLSFETNSI